MHELSIALNLIDLANEEAQRHEGRVSALHIKLGHLSGVVQAALLSSFEVAAYGTPLEGARLVIEEVATVIYCRECSAKRELEFMASLFCPVCGSSGTDLLQGKEMELTSLEMQS
jgi:hydrogenase nickel incorporation protein HypA/HybF